MGLHFLIAFAIAYIVAGNFLAAGLGTFIGNPVTFPFIWAATYSSGNFILHRKMDEGDGSGIMKLADVQWMDLGWSGILEVMGGIWEPLLKPMLIGGIPIGTTFAIVAYILTRAASRKFRDRRMKKLEKPSKPASGPKIDSSNNMQNSAAE